MATVFATVSTPGPPGPAGPPGYSPAWIVAPGAPTSGTGNVGDMYINSTTGDVYGPKTAGGWGTIQANIKGAPGATGPTGAPGYTPQYIVAPGPPSPATGNNSDMYINSTTSDVYGPKTAGAWGPIVCNIKGATGAQGPPGVAYTPRGAWSAATTYAQGDEVTYSSQLYIGLQAANLNNVPSTSPTWWQMVGSGGSQTPWLSDIDGAAFTLKNVGKIGIGTVPVNPLDVGTGSIGAVGGVQITVTSNAANSGISIGQNAANRGRVLWNYNATVASAYMTIECLGGNPLCLQTLGGNVGIGNTAAVLPDAAVTNLQVIIGVTTGADVASELHIAGLATVSGNAVGLLSFPNYAIAGTDKRLAAITANAVGGLNNGDMRILTMNAGALTEKMRVTAAGNVGVGTTSPVLPLSIVGTVAGAYNGVAIANLNSTVGSTAVLGFAMGNQGGTPTASIANVLESAAGGGLAFSTYSAGIAERMRITAAGNVGIGTTNPGSQLTVIPATTPSTVATINQIAIGEATNNSAYRLSLGYGSIGGANVGVVQATQNVAGTYLLLNPSGGNVGIGKTAPAFALDVTGDCNVTGVYRVNGTAISTSGGPTTQSNATGVRSFGTVYQNTTGKPMFISITVSASSGSGISCYTDTSSNPSTAVAFASSFYAAGASNVGCSFWVLPNSYYKVTGASSLNAWFEWW